MREDRTYNIRPPPYIGDGANIPSRGIIGLGKGYRKACDITLTAGKATGQLYPREEKTEGIMMFPSTSFSDSRLLYHNKVSVYLPHQQNPTS